MRTVEVIVDTQYLYHHHGSRLDYGKVIEYAAEFGEVIKRTAFGYRTKGNGPFQHMLKHKGFEVTFASRQQTAELTIALIDTQADIVLLVSGDAWLEPAVKRSPAEIIIMATSAECALSKHAFSAITLSGELLCN